MKNSKKSDLLLPDAPNPTKQRRPVWLEDWGKRHVRAMRSPATLYEQALVGMLHGWEDYAAAHREAYETKISADGVLGQHWFAIGDGLLGLLNGQLDRLDGGTLDRTIRTLLYPFDYDEASVDSDLGWDAAPTGMDEKETQGAALVFAYSRAQAISDGVLIDVTDTAKEAGYRFPTAVTQALWADIHAIPERLQGAADGAGRLWDILFLGRYALQQQSANSTCLFEVHMPVERAWWDYKIKAVCGPGDDAEPVITLMRPEED